MDNLIRNLTGTVAAITFAIGLAGSAAAQSVPETDEPITLALLEWTGQHISAKIAGHILEDMGYTVEYVTAGSYPSGISLSDGEIDGVIEFWSNNQGEFYPKLIEEGKVKIVGDIGLNAREGWLYPKYMEELCPGLPAWDALTACSELLAVPETYPDGRILAYPADWGHRSADIIAETGIPFQAVPAGSEGALVAELNSAVERKAPLVMMFWAPHWVLSTVDYGWVDLPPDIAEEYALMAVPVWKIVWPGFEGTWPAAYRFLEAFQLDNASQERMMDLIDNQGEDLDAVTKAWVDDHTDVWQPWVDQALAGS